MQDSEYLVDDGQFQGIFSDIDRATKATSQRLQATGFKPQDPKFMEYIGKVEAAVMADRRKVLHDEAIDSGLPKEYAEYRASAYGSGRSVMPFGVWTKNRRGALEAELSDFIGQGYVTVEQSAAGTVGGTVTAVLNQFGDASQYRTKAEFYKELLKNRDQILARREQELLNAEKIAAYKAGLKDRPAGEEPSWLEALAPAQYKDQVADLKVKTREEIEKEFPIPEILTQQLAELAPTADLYGKILYQDYLTGKNVSESVVSGIRSWSTSHPMLSGGMAAGVAQLENPTDPTDTSLKSDVLQDTSGVGKFLGEVAGTTLVSAPAYVNPMFLAPFFPMGYQGGQERLINNYARESRRAALLGLEAPESPFGRLREAGLKGGFSEVLSEGVGNAIEKAILVNKAWRGASAAKAGEAAAKKMPMSQWQRLSRDIMEGAMDAKGGSRGLAALAKKAVRGGKMAKQYGPALAMASATEMLEEVANETYMSIGVDSITGSNDFKSWWENSFHASMVAALSAGGTSGVVLAAKELEYRRIRAQVEQMTEDRFGKNWKDGVDPEKAEALITAAIKDAGERHAARRTDAMIPYAYGERMAMRQVAQYTDSGRLGIIVEKSAKGVTVTRKVRDEMEAAGIDVDNPLEYGNTLIYTTPAMAPQVAAAYERGEIEKINGTEAFAGRQTTGLAVIRDRSGAVVEVIPATKDDDVMNADSQTPFYSWVSARLKEGEEVKYVEGEEAAQVADSINASVDMAFKSQGKPPRDIARNRPANMAGGLRRLKSMLNYGLKKEIAEDQKALAENPNHSSFLAAMGFDPSQPVTAEVKVTAVSNKRLSEDEKRITTMGMGTAVVEGHVQWSGKDKNGKDISFKKSIAQQGLYAAQASEDGLFLVRDEKGSAFTFRNAWAVAIHEAMHRNVARSRGGAQWLNMLFSMAPEENIAEGLKALRKYPTFNKGMTDAELMNDMIARYEAAQMVVGDVNATEDEKAKAAEDIAVVRQFGEEMATNVVESHAGSMGAHAAAYVAAYQHEKGMSLMKFAGWLSHTLVKNGFSGPQAQAIHDMFTQRAGAVREAELQLDEKFRGEATQRYRAALRNEESWRQSLQERGAKGERGVIPSEQKAEEQPAEQPVDQAAPEDQGQQAASPMPSMRGEKTVAPPRFAPAKSAVPPDEEEEKPTPTRASMIAADAVGLLASVAQLVTMPMAQVVTPSVTTERVREEQARSRASQQPVAQEQQREQTPEENVARILTERAKAVADVSMNLDSEYFGVMASFRDAPRRKDINISPAQKRWLTAKGRNLAYQPTREVAGKGVVEGEATVFLHGTATPTGKPWSYLRPSEFGRWGGGIYLWKDEGGALSWAQKTQADRWNLHAEETTPVVIRTIARINQPFYVNAQSKNAIVQALNDRRNVGHIKRFQQQLAELADAFDYRTPLTAEVRDRAKQAIKDQFVALLKKNGFDSMVVENSARPTDYEEARAGVREPKRGKDYTVSEIIVWNPLDVKDENYDMPTEALGLMASMRPIAMSEVPTGVRRKLRGSVLHNKETDEIGVVYHGTSAKDEFSKFAEEKLGANTGAASAREAFFFSDNPNVASGYAMAEAVVSADAEAASPISPMNAEASREQAQRAEQAETFAIFDEDENGWIPQIRYIDSYGVETTDRVGGVRGPVYKNQTDAEDAAFNEQKSMIDAAYGRADAAQKMRDETVSERATGARIMPSMLAMKNPLVHDFKGESWREQSFADLIRQAKENGNDGVVFKNVTDPAVNETWASEPSNVYAVFKSNQIIPALANKTTAGSEYMASMRRTIDLTEAPKFDQGMSRYDTSPFSPRLLRAKEMLKDHILNGTPLAGVVTDKPVAIKHWIDWLGKIGVNKSHVRWSLPWLFKNKYGMPVQRAARDRAAEREAKEKRKAAEREAEKQGRTLKPLPEPQGDNEKITAMQFLAELEAAVPWTYEPVFLGVNDYPSIRGIVQQRQGENYAVGMILKPMGQTLLTETDMIEQVREGTQDPLKSAEAEKIRTSVLEARPLRDVVAAKMDTKFNEPHWSIQNLLIHYRYTRVLNPRNTGDIFADELQSVFRAKGQKANGDTDQFYFPEIKDPNSDSAFSGVVPDGKWNLTERVREIPILSEDALASSTELFYDRSEAIKRIATDLPKNMASEVMDSSPFEFMRTKSERTVFELSAALSSAIQSAAATQDPIVAETIRNDIAVFRASAVAQRQERSLFLNRENKPAALVPVELAAFTGQNIRDFPVSSQIVSEKAKQTQGEYDFTAGGGTQSELGVVRDASLALVGFGIDRNTIGSLIGKRSVNTPEQLDEFRRVIEDEKKTMEFILNSSPNGKLDVDYMQEKFPDVNWSAIAPMFNELVDQAVSVIDSREALDQAATYVRNPVEGLETSVTILASEEAVRKAQAILDSSPELSSFVGQQEPMDERAAVRSLVYQAIDRSMYPSQTMASSVARKLSELTGKEYSVVVSNERDLGYQDLSLYESPSGPLYSVVLASEHQRFMDDASPVAERRARLAIELDAARDEYYRSSSANGYHHASTMRAADDYRRINVNLDADSRLLNQMRSEMYDRSAASHPLAAAVMRQAIPAEAPIIDMVTDDLLPVIAPILRSIRSWASDAEQSRDIVLRAASVAAGNTVFVRATEENRNQVHRFDITPTYLQLRDPAAAGEPVVSQTTVGYIPEFSGVQIGSDVVRPARAFYHHIDEYSVAAHASRMGRIVNETRSDRLKTALLEAKGIMLAEVALAEGAKRGRSYLAQDTDYARQQVADRIGGGDAVAAQSVADSYRIPYASSEFLYRMHGAVSRADTSSRAIVDRLSDFTAPDSRRAEVENPPNPLRLLRPAPLTHELKNEKGAVMSEDFLHALFAGLVRDVFGHGGDIGSSVIFPLPNDTATNSQMAPLAAASYYGWTKEHALFDIWENLVRGNFSWYVDAQGIRLSRGPYGQESMAAASDDWLVRLQNQTEKAVWGAVHGWIETTDSEGNVRRQAPDSYEYGGEHRTSSIISQAIMAEDTRPQTLQQYLTLVENALTRGRNELHLKFLDDARSRFRQDVLTQEQEDEAKRFADQKMANYRSAFTAGQIERLFGAYLKAKDEFAAAQQEGREPKLTKGILRSKLEAWAAEHGGTVSREVYPNTDGKERMVLTIDQRLKDTATEGFPMASMRRGIMGGFDLFRQGFLDKYGELARYVEEERRRRGSRLPDASNPYQGARVLSAVMASKQRDLQREYATILRDMYEEGITTEMMDMFLLAQHAKERNKTIAERDPATPDGGSGMSNIDAQDILDNAMANGTYAVKDQLARRWRSILRRNLDMRVDSGLMTQETRDAIEDRWKRYVPLRGKPLEPFDEDFEDAPTGTGTGSLSTSGRGMPVALGRESVAQDITSQVGFVSEDTIKRVERNNIGNRFLNLVMAVNDVGMAQVIKPTKFALVNGRKRSVYDFQWSSNPRNFGLYLNRDMTIDGEDYSKGDLVVIQINNPRLATAMGKAIDVGMLRTVLETPNNIFRTLTTGLLSPVWMAVNTMRDVGMGTLVNYSQHGIKDTVQMIRKYPSSAWNIIRDEWTNQGPTGDYRRYVEAGGDMAWGKPNDLELKAMEFQRMYKSVSKRDPNQTALRDYLFGWYPALFKASETSMRLSHFKRRVEMGMTDEQAALSSRDLTIDFARGGTLKPIFNTLYIYSNAGIQGTDATLRALGSAKELGPMLVGAGYLCAVMARAHAGVDPKTGLNRWDMIRDYEKASSIYLFSPDGSGKGVSFPQPYGFNVLFALGQDIADSLHGPKKRGEVVSNTIDNATNFLNPFGGSGITKGMSNMVSFAFPTLLRWMPELAQNTDFADRPIYPENKFGPETAQAYQAFDSTPELYRWVAERANEYSGGNEIDSGFVDFHPDSLEYMIGFIFSGAGRAVQRTVDVATGEKPISEAPFVRNFTVSPDTADKFAMSEFYKLRDELAKEIVRAREMAKGQQGRNLGTLDQTRYALALEAKEIDSQIKEIRKQMKSVTDPETIKALQQQRLDLMKYMVSRYYQLTRQK